MIWGPFLMALVLGLIVSAGLYFAYLWPQVEPEDEDEAGDPATPGRPTVSSTDPESATPAASSESTPA